MRKTTLLKHAGIRILCFLLVAAGIVATPSTARSDPSDEAEASIKKADAQLNAVYTEMLAKIVRTDARENMMIAQRAWISFRDAEAEFRASLGNRGGIVYAHGLTMAMVELTNERIEQLQRLQKENPFWDADFPRP